MCLDCRAIAARVLAVALQRELADRHTRLPEAQDGAEREINFAAIRAVVGLFEAADPAIYSDDEWHKLVASHVAALDDETLTLTRKIFFWQSAVFSDIVLATRVEMSKRVPSGSAEIASGLYEADLDDRTFTQSTITALLGRGAAIPSYSVAKGGIPVS